MTIRTPMLVLALAAATAAAPAVAQPDTLEPFGLDLVPLGQAQGVTLGLQLSRLSADAAESSLGGHGVQLEDLGAVTIGDYVIVCFTASRDGYVSIWSHDAASNDVARIYPNPYMPIERGENKGMPIRADVETCIGDGEEFRLEVAGPLGPNQLYYMWTLTDADQLPEDSYISVGEFVAAVPESTGGSANYVDQHFTYHVVE